MAARPVLTGRLSLENFGSTDSKYPGTGHMCLLLACFGVAAGCLPCTDVATMVFGWLLSKRQAPNDFMSADDLPFLILCRYYFRVRVMVYRLTGEERAELSFDTHDDAEAGGSWPSALAVRSILFKNDHFLRIIDDRYEDTAVESVLNAFWTDVSGSQVSLDEVRQDMDRELRKHIEKIEKEEQKTRQMQQDRELAEQLAAVDMQIQTDNMLAVQDAAWLLARHLDVQAP